MRGTAQARFAQVKLVDLNILLYATNVDAHHHPVVRRWWEDALNGDETIGLAWPVLLGFLRLSTHQAVFSQPLPVPVALNQINQWLAQPTVSVVGEKRKHWTRLRALLAETGAAGNLTTDAHLAALAQDHDGVLVSCDQDFARFPGLRWENPIAGRG